MHRFLAVAGLGFLVLAVVCIAAAFMEKVFPWRGHGKDLDAKTAVPFSNFIRKPNEAVTVDSILCTMGREKTYFFPFARSANSAVLLDASVRIIGNCRQFIGKANVSVANGSGSTPTIYNAEFNIPIYPGDRFGNTGIM